MRQSPIGQSAYAIKPHPHTTSLYSTKFQESGFYSLQYPGCQRINRVLRQKPIKENQVMCARDWNQGRRYAQHNAIQTGVEWIVFADTSGNVRVERRGKVDPPGAEIFHPRYDTHTGLPFNSSGI
jgi:hypothetical protein